MAPDTEEATRPNPGRKKLNPEAREFIPQIKKDMPTPVDIERSAHDSAHDSVHKDTSDVPPEGGGRKKKKTSAHAQTDNSAPTRHNPRPQRIRRRPMRFGGNCYD